MSTRSSPNLSTMLPAKYRNFSRKEIAGKFRAKYRIYRESGCVLAILFKLLWFHWANVVLKYLVQIVRGTSIWNHATKCYKIRNTDTISTRFAFLIRVTIHFYQSRRFIRRYFGHKAGAKWSKLSETKGNAKRNMEISRAWFASKISKCKFGLGLLSTHCIGQLGTSLF